MNNFTITVQVNLGVNPEVVSLVKPIIDHLLSQTPAPAAALDPKPAKPAKTEKKPKTENKPAKEEAPADPAPVAEDPAPAADPAPVAEDPAPDPVPEEAATAADPAPTVAQEYTEEDVRAAMDRTRKRIEGENYKGHPDSEGYKTWHRPLTAWFKNTAAIYGAEKPSLLADSGSRARFIKECDEVQVINGELTAPLPF